MPTFSHESTSENYEFIIMCSVQSNKYANPNQTASIEIRPSAAVSFTSSHILKGGLV